MQLRALIIDDEKKGINLLRILIEEFAPDIKIVAESTNAIEGLTLIENYLPEIVFLDINMPGMNGFELLERLQWKNFNLVFVTGHHEYGLQALKNNAIDYILKPIDYHEIQNAVQRIKMRIQQGQGSFLLGAYADLLSEIKQQNKNRILVNLRSGIEAIDTAEIIHLQSKANHTNIYFDNALELLTSKPIKDFENSLCNEHINFMRVHKSYIINLNKVVRYHKTQDIIIMTNAVKIPLAKTRKTAFFHWLKVC